MPATPSLAVAAIAILQRARRRPPRGARTVSTGITRSCRLLPPCTKPAAACRCRRPRSSPGTSGSRRLRRSRDRRARPGPRPGGRRRPREARAGASDRSRRPCVSCSRRLVEQQEAVVGGEDEAAHARFAQQLPGRAQLLQHLVEHGGPDAGLARSSISRCARPPAGACAIDCLSQAASRVDDSSSVSHGQEAPPTRSCMARLRSRGRRRGTRRSRSRGRVRRRSTTAPASGGRWSATGARTFMPTSVTVGSSASRAFSCAVVAGVSASDACSSSPISKRKASTTK